MVVTELQRYLAGVLRYFASSIVGVAVVWLFDNDHDILTMVLTGALPVGLVPPVWALVGLLAVTGLATYFLHRAVFHGLATRGILQILRRKHKVPSAMDLDFSRWNRRGSKEGTRARSAQNALDEVNAAAHFLYCSGWASLLIFSFMHVADPAHSNWSWRFAAVVAFFLVAGFVADFNAGRYDVEAHQRFKGDDA